MVEEQKLWQAAVQLHASKRCHGSSTAGLDASRPACALQTAVLLSHRVRVSVAHALREQDYMRANGFSRIDWCRAETGVHPGWVGTTDATWPLSGNITLDGLGTRA